MDDMQEIISRPPSHPIATTLLLVSILGLIVAISIVWTELFSEYLRAPKAGEKGNYSKSIAEQHIHDHYGKDYPEPQNQMMQKIEEDLGIKTAAAGTPTAGQAGGQQPPPPGP